MLATEKLGKELILSIKKSISEADGNEVAMVAPMGLKSTEVTVIARGNSFSTPAIMRFCIEGSILIHNHPSGVLEPSDADLEVAHILSDMGVSAAIVDNRAENIYFITDPDTICGNRFIDLKKVESIFSESKEGKKDFLNYEYRPEQQEMALFVANAFNEDNISVIEAGTGTGKSLAYLVPAAIWASENNRKAIISTATLNLQEQLLKKDIPQLKKMLGFDLKTAIIKGRSNYLCRRRMDTVKKEQRMLFEDQKMDMLDHILEWYKNTETGCRDELDIHVDMDIWDNICSEMDTCSGNNCRHFSSCFVNKARRSAFNAHLVLINHHLLCADLSILNITGRNGILPSYSKLIVDEAHNLDSVAGKHFGINISLAGFKRNMARLLSRSKRKKGFLPAFEKEISKSCSSEKSFMEDMEQRLQKITELRFTAESGLENFFRQFYEFACHRILVSRHTASYGNNMASGVNTGEKLSSVKLRLNKYALNDQDFQTQVLPSAAELIKNIKMLVINAEKMVDHAADHMINQNLVFESLAREIKACLNRIDSRCSDISSIIFKKENRTEQEKPENDDLEVSWFEGSLTQKGLRCKLVSAPINPGEALRKNLFEKIKTIVLTSATITVNHSFDFFLKKMWLEPDRHSPLPLCVKTKSIGSPFNYKKQCILSIPTDIPFPNDPGFEKEISDFIADLITVTSGRALILFTSFRMLFNVAEAVRIKLTRICEKISEPPFDLFCSGK
jgi:ATP-dependent DNA helicase DinG